LSILADITEDNQVNKTIEIELAGINTAAIIGFSSALTAKYNPIKLYPIEIAKLIQMIFRILRDISKNLSKFFNSSPNIIASLPGEK
jgi:hypothetical protein